MKSPAAATEDIVSRLSELRSSDERRVFFEANPTLRSPEVVTTLCAELDPLSRKSMRRARRFSEGLTWLAGTLEDGPSQAWALRARANFLHRSGDYRVAMEVYEEALKRFKDLGDVRQVAITRRSSIQNLNYLGQYERASEWVSSAREAFRRLGEPRELAVLDVAQGSILYRQDRWEEALGKYRQAYEQLLEVGTPLDAIVALRNAAVCQISLNRFNEALESYALAKEFCRENQLEVLGLENDYNIAYLYYLRGEYTRAIHLYQEARRECERLNNREHLALCDLDQAEVFLELNLVEEAAELGKSAYEKFNQLGMNYESAKGLTLLAIAVSRQGKGFLALELLGKARDIFVEEQNRVWPALIDLYRALVLYSERRLVEATSLGSRALEVFTNVDFPTKAAMCEIVLARLDLESGRTRQARDKCLAALERIEPLNVPALEYQAHFVLGQMEEALGDREAALASYRRSHEKLERLRSHLQTDELKITFLEDKLVIYEDLVTLHVHAGGADEDKESAFAYIEKAKSRSLADLMAFRAHALPAKATTHQNLVDQIRNLREELNWYYRQIDLREMRPDERSRTQLDKLRQESREREEHLLRTLREMQTTDREFSSLQDASTLDLDAIRAELPENCQIVELYIARGIIYACVLDRTTLEIVPLTIVSRVLDTYHLLKFQLSKFLLGTDYVKEFRHLVDEATSRHLRTLYSELIEPIRHLLTAEHLTIVPHDFMHLVPFHALFDGESFLIDHYSISYAPSASVDYFCRVKETDAEDRSLVLGIYDEQVPHILEEVRAVAEELGDARLLLNEDANQENLKVLGERCRILHIATHGVFRRDNPMFSAIQLGGSRLSLFDLYDLRLNAELVVLSGCGTGLSVVVGADELVGLARGLLYAGAQTVLVTLWDVNDASTALFMRSFYRSLREEGSPAKAFQRATREARTEHPHPYYWAPFILVGRSG